MINPTFKQLEALYFSLSLGSFSAAAIKLHTTQSAISKRIGELETMIGEPLIQRRATGLQATGMGSRMLPLAEESIRLKHRISAEVTGDQSLRGVIRIGVTELIGLTWFPRLICELRARYPDLRVASEVEAGLKLFESLAAGALDVILVPGLRWGSQYRVVKVGEVEQVWLANPRFTLPRRALRPNDFSRYPVLELSSGAAKNVYYAAWREENHIEFGDVLTSNSCTVLRNLAIRNQGLVQLALDYCRTDILRGDLRVVDSEPKPPVLVYSAVFRDDGFHAGAEKIAQMARELCDFSIRADHCA